MITDLHFREVVPGRPHDGGPRYGLLHDPDRQDHQPPHSDGPDHESCHVSLILPTSAQTLFNESSMRLSATMQAFVGDRDPP